MCPGIAVKRAGSAAPAPPGRDHAAWRADATSNNCRPLPVSATASTPPGPNAIAVMGRPACIGRQGVKGLTYPASSEKAF